MFDEDLNLICTPDMDQSNIFCNIDSSSGRERIEDEACDDKPQAFLPLKKKLGLYDPVKQEKALEEALNSLYNYGRIRREYYQSTKTQS